MQIETKHWTRALAIATVAATAAAALIGSCVFDSRTNFCEQFGVRCKAGQQCALHEPVCIDIGGCGDGIVDRSRGEVCDDGNLQAGEFVDNAFVPDKCSPDCKSDQMCGNEIQDMGEECDHGTRNGAPDDGCDTTCLKKVAFCGNAIIEDEREEECDTGGLDTEGCNGNLAVSDLPDHAPVACKFRVCGDGYVNMAAHEECDTLLPTVDCDGAPLCTHPTCGDHFQNGSAGEDCDNGSDDTSGCNGAVDNHGAANRCKFPACGDGYLNRLFKPPGSSKQEACDSGSDSSGCNGNGPGDLDARCQPPSCGDGYINNQFKPDGTHAEECDNKASGDTKDCNSKPDRPSSCRTPTCGDGYLNTEFKPDGIHAEVCDEGGNTQHCNGDGSAGDADDARCQKPACGDGYVNRGFKPDGSMLFEDCDNHGGGNTVNCNGNNGGSNGSGSCHTPSCGDGYINDKVKPDGTHPEECDNGSANSNTVPDACRTSCRKHFCGDGVKDGDEQCDPAAPPGACGAGQSSCVSSGSNACHCS